MNRHEAWKVGRCELYQTNDTDHLNRERVVFHRKIADNAPRSSLGNKPGNSPNNNTRGVMMKLQNILLVTVVLIIPGTVWAYGDSGSSSGAGVCNKLNFSEFSPMNNAEVAPQSAFSFYASGATYPNSIKVTIKGQSVPVTVTPKQDGYKVSGMLPDTLKGAFAKINIAARGINQCEVSDGWLVKVTE